MSDPASDRWVVRTEQGDPGDPGGDTWIAALHLPAARALVAGTWMRRLTNPLFFFILALGWMLPPLTALFVWSTAAEGGPVAGFDRGAFVAYYLVLVAVTQLTRTENSYYVGGAIYSGQMNAWLLRPMPPHYEALALDLSYKGITAVTVLPFVGALALLMGPTLHPAPWQVLCFVPAVVAGWALSFAWSYALALLAFWLQKMEAVYGLQAALTFVLAGQVAPVALLPDGLRQSAAALPFRYMAAFPAELLTAAPTPDDVVRGFCWQGTWLAAVLVLAALLWRRGVRRYAAVGG